MRSFAGVPEVEPFVAAAAPIDALLEEILADRQVSSRDSQPAIAFGLTTPGTAMDDAVLAEVRVSGWGFESGAHVGLSDRALALDVASRTALVWQVYRSALRTLARTHDWDDAGLEEVLSEVEARRLEFRTHGSWKTSPSRRLRMRPAARLAPDARTRVHLEVADAHTGANLGVTASHWFGAGNVRQLRRLLGSIRWTGSSEVTTERILWGPPTSRESVRFDTAHLFATVPDPDPSEPAQPVPSVRVDAVSSRSVVVHTWGARGTDDPKWISAGLDSFVNSGSWHYNAAVGVYGEWIAEKAAAWWEPAVQSRLEVRAFLGILNTKSRIYVRDDEVLVNVDRNAHTVDNAESDRTLARTDLQDALVKVAARCGLGSPPMLPTVQALSVPIDDAVRLVQEQTRGRFTTVAEMQVQVDGD